MRMTTDAEWTLVRNHRKVTFSHIGEGWNGDYNPNDPDDTPLLRFDIYEMVNGEWEQMDDASYCTGLSVDADPETIREALEVVMNSTYDLERVKREAERLSWL